MTQAAPPTGFVHLPMRGATTFTASAGPWFVKDEDGGLVGGLRVLPHLLNPLGMCHGGVLATFCDVLLPMAGVYQAELETGLTPTVSLSLDYLKPTPAGAWVEGRAQVLRRGRTLVFLQALLTVDGHPTVRANGVFSIPATPAGRGLGDMLRSLLGTARAGCG